MSPTQARSCYRHFHREGRINDDAPEAVKHSLQWAGQTPACTQRDADTTKFTTDLGNGLETETVVIPGVGSGGRQRKTLCVSSQVGCAMGCGFCETAQMGLQQQLTTAEIVRQWFQARHVLGHVIDNIVFMGMGEPMDNLDAVIDAIRVFADRNGPAIASSRITVSTVGRTKGIQKLTALANESGFKRLGLAVSVNAPNDAIRSSIMPINRAEPMGQLRDAMLQWPGQVLVEYVLIPGVNDAASHAAELATYVAPLRSTVNVIPYNPRRDSPWPAPDEDCVSAFVDQLARQGCSVRRRGTHGRSVMAACGQLGNERIRRHRRPTAVTLNTTS